MDRFERRPRVALRCFERLKRGPGEIRRYDLSGFIVAWSGSGPIAEPIIEAVMVGTLGNASYSFVSQGRAIRTVGRSRWFDFRPR